MERERERGEKRREGGNKESGKEGKERLRWIKDNADGGKIDGR